MSVEVSLKNVDSGKDMKALLVQTNLELYFKQPFVTKAITGRDLYGCSSVEDLKDLLDMKQVNRPLRLLWTHVEDWKEHGVPKNFLGNEVERKEAVSLKEQWIDSEFSKSEEMAFKLWDITFNLLHNQPSKFGNFQDIEVQSAGSEPISRYANACLCILYWTSKKAGEAKETLSTVVDGEEILVLDKDPVLAAKLYHETLPWLLQQPVSDYFSKFLLGYLYEHQVVEHHFVAFMRMPETNEDASRSLIYLNTFYQPAADRHFLPALFFLGRGYVLHCHHHREIFAQGVEMLKLAATHGSNDAALFLAEHYRNGFRGFEKNPRLAVVYFGLAADRGHVAAQKILGEHYANSDFSLAVHYFSLAAAASNDEEIYFTLAQLYKEPGLHRNYAKAIENLKLAADYGHPEAEFELGELYFTGGHGLRRSYSAAVAYYTLSVEKYQNVKAALALADCYEHGLGVRRDMEHGRELREMADVLAQRENSDD